MLNLVLLGYSLEHGVADLNSCGDGGLEGWPDNGVIYGDEGERYNKDSSESRLGPKKKGSGNPPCSSWVPWNERRAYAHRRCILAHLHNSALLAGAEGQEAYGQFLHVVSAYL